MGCDIHVYRERKKEGEWETSSIQETADYEYVFNGFEAIGSLESRYVRRNYVLFAFLSGVRNYGEHGFHFPIAGNRGFPDDCLEIHKGLLEDDDLHSHGFLTYAELKALIKDVKVNLTKATITSDSRTRLVLEGVLNGLTNLDETVNWDNYFEGLNPETECRILIAYDN